MNKQGIKNSDNIGRMGREGGWSGGQIVRLRSDMEGPYNIFTLAITTCRGGVWDRGGGGAPANCASIVVPTSSAVYISLTLMVPRSKGPLMRRESVELRR